MTAAPLLLVPPSEGKNPGGRGPARPLADGGDVATDRVRQQLAEAVRAQLDAGGLSVGASLFGVGGPHLERALAEWADLERAPTLPAWQRYGGVVWQGLDPHTLDRAGRSRLRRRVVVVSALWGAVRAEELLPPYRLAMGARVEGIGRPSNLWRPVLGARLAMLVGDGVVFDLLPTVYSQAIDAQALAPGRLVRVEVRTADGRAAIGHAGKHIKGRLVRRMLEADVRSARALGRVEVEGLEHLATERDPDGHRRVIFAARTGGTAA